VLPMAKLLVKFVYLFRSIFNKLGVDFNRMMAIVEIKLLMDRRRVYMNWKQQQQKKESDTHLTVVLLVYAFFGLLIGVAVYFIPSIILSMIFLHAYILFMMAMTLITDFSTVLLDTADNQVILPKPVSGKTLFMARLVHILIYLLQFTIAIASFPVIATLIKYGVATGLGSIITVLLTVLLAVFFTYFIYLLILRFSSEEKVKEIITYFQIIMTVAFTLGYQILPRLINLKELTTDFELGTASYFLPPVWMALTLDAINNFNFDWLHLTMIALATILPLTGFWLMNKYLAPVFAARLQAMQTAASKRITSITLQSAQKSVSSSLSKIFCNNIIEKASFEFTWKMTGRDKSFKLQFYPSLAYIIVFLFIFVFKSGRSLQSNWEALPNTNNFMWLIYLPMFTISSSIILVAFNENYIASWLYHSTPIKNPGAVVAGSIKSLFVKYFIPVYLFMFAFAFYIWGIAITDDFVFGFANNLLCYLVFCFFSEHYLPFSRQPSTQQQTGRLLRMILQMLIVGILVGVHYFTIKSTTVFYILLPLLLTGSWLLLKKIQQLPWKKIAV
jgi:ABC-2 type transport system permease protein